MRDNRDILDKLLWLSNDMEYMEVPGEWLPPVTEAAAEIEKLRAALRDCLGWHDYSNDMHKPIEVRAAYMRARAALEGK